MRVGIVVSFRLMYVVFWHVKLCNVCMIFVMGVMGLQSMDQSAVYLRMIMEKKEENCRQY